MDHKNTSNSETVHVRKITALVAASDVCIWVLFLQFRGTFVTIVFNFCLFCCDVHFILGSATVEMIMGVIAEVAISYLVPVANHGG